MSRRVSPVSHFTEKLADSYRDLGISGQALLLAVSGGADSTALLVASAHLAPALGLTLATASLDHGLRPESGAEIRAVRALCQKLGVPFYSRNLALAEGAQLEARARRARYQALEEIRRQASCHWVATAHTASDQAETLLMRLLRGASLSGAGGIRRRVGRVIRPLLGYTRQEIERFLRRQEISFAEDPMNRDARFARARIRTALMPALDLVGGSQAARHLAEFAAAAASDAELLDALAGAAYGRLLVAPGTLDGVGLRALHPAVRGRVLARLLHDAGAAVERRALCRAVQASSTGVRATLSRGFELHCAGGLIRCIAPSATLRSDALLLPRGGWVHSPSGLRIGVIDELPAEAMPGEWLSVSAGCLPLTVRRRRPGDRVGPGRGHKLQDLMVDRRIPREQRDSIPIVCDAAGNILWVIGVWPRGKRPVRGAAPGPFVLAQRMPGAASARWLGSL